MLYNDVEWGISRVRYNVYVGLLGSFLTICLKHVSVCVFGRQGRTGRGGASFVELSLGIIYVPFFFARNCCQPTVSEELPPPRRAFSAYFSFLFHRTKLYGLHTCTTGAFSYSSCRPRTAFTPLPERNKKFTRRIIIIIPRRFVRTAEYIVFT